jgi:benzil reductase ((S)-benzoin forming)
MRLALITGGSKGLGKALVDLYSENEWEVKEFSRSGKTRHNINCDFSNPTGSASVINETFFELSTHHWSEVVLINNAGTLNPIGPIDLSNAGAWQENIQVNLNSCITSTGLFLKYFGKVATCYIANISSGAANKPYFGWSLYCASKAAIEAFTMCVALEQSQTSNPVTAFIINPGVIDTGMQELIRSQDKACFKDLDRFKQLKSDKSLQTPSKVAKAIYSIVDSSPKSGEKYDVRSYF